MLQNYVLLLVPFSCQWSYNKIKLIRTRWIVDIFSKYDTRGLCSSEIYAKRAGCSFHNTHFSFIMFHMNVCISMSMCYLIKTLLTWEGTTKVYYSISKRFIMMSSSTLIALPCHLVLEWKKIQSISAFDLICTMCISRRCKYWPCHWLQCVEQDKCIHYLAPSFYYCKEYGVMVISL